MDFRFKTSFPIILLVLVFSFSITTASAKNKTRRFLTTIQWYPPSEPQLNQMTADFFNNVKNHPVPGKIVGLVSPHAGLAYSGQCAANGFIHLKQRHDIQRVILLGVSHRGGFYGAAVSDFEFNSTPLGSIPVDTEITSKLAQEKYFTLNNRLMQDEHSLENQLPFLQAIMKQAGNENYKIVPILFGGLEKKHFKTMADVLNKYVNENTVVIASSDFTHYGDNYRYTPFRKDIKKNLTRLDMGMIEAVTEMDFERYYTYKEQTGITMCGFIPVGVLLNMFGGGNYRGTMTDYYRSGDRGNDYSMSVSYASIAISNQPATGMNLSDKEKKTLLALARQSLIDHFGGNVTDMTQWREHHKDTLQFNQKVGVFVTLKKKDRLRGCIGTIIGREPLCDGVQNNALSAGLRDPRFEPVKQKELADIDIEISVMTPLQRISDYKKIRLGIDGVIIRKGYSQAVYLPQVATETGWGLDRFLSSLCQKAGLPQRAYKSDDMEFYIFQALVFGEKEPETIGKGTGS